MSDSEKELEWPEEVTRITLGGGVPLTANDPILSRSPVTTPQHETISLRIGASMRGSLLPLDDVREYSDLLAALVDLPFVMRALSTGSISNDYSPVDILDQNLTLGIWEIIDIGNDSTISPKYWSRLVRPSCTYHLNTNGGADLSQLAFEHERISTQFSSSQVVQDSRSSSSIAMSYAERSSRTDESIVSGELPIGMSVRSPRTSFGDYKKYQSPISTRLSYYATLSVPQSIADCGAWSALYGNVASTPTHHSHKSSTRSSGASMASGSSDSQASSNRGVVSTTNIVLIAFRDMALPAPFPKDLSTIRRCSFSMTTQLWRATRALCSGSNARYRMYHIVIQEDMYGRKVMYKGKAVTGDRSQTLGSLGFNVEDEEYFVWLVRE